jgi:hypothetical protein
MAERRFRRTQEWPQIADESVWQTVDAALISDHVHLFCSVWGIPTRQLPLCVWWKRHRLRAVQGVVVPMQPHQSAVVMIIFRGVGWYVLMSTEGRYFKPRRGAVTAS